MFISGREEVGAETPELGTGGGDVEKLIDGVDVLLRDL